ncbi:UNVERIFIED_CONTAM: Serine/threonine-protein kinase haspin [Sesamum calycinum]|uniref:non-specific serine/threonine protein kinase n=1 Tax=Sesamum calycinum TaxID=2727403 RepID=A0AAW2JE36_9LAMI
MAVIYQRKKAEVMPQKDVPRRQSNSSAGSRTSIALVTRVSWNRSLSTRGRTSIAATACVDHQPQQRKPGRKVKPPLPRVTLALAVAEAAYEFEHRDLHWGNILLSRNGSATLQFILEGKKLQVRNFGLLISIIDFTLSRINTGEDILFLDLSSDPALFEGPKGDKQADTYRKMRDVTDECWEGSFPKTNVLWLQYLVDILLLKKSYERTPKDERELRSLKKRLHSYGSAKEAASDPFFSDLLISE